MTKKKVGLGNLSFQKIDPYGNNIKRDGSDSDSAILYHIETILPDPGQPRRLLPEHLAEQLYDGTLTPISTLQEWQRLAAEADADASIKRSFTGVERLASSIEQQGLINPISIRKSEEPLLGSAIYLIVTGERRWWAHVLLTAQDRPIQAGPEPQAPEQIKATLTHPGVTIRAHQLIENLLREDINLVEKANGILALRHELSGVNMDVAHGRHLPKLDKDHKLVPWKEVEDVLDISRQYRIRLLKVLALSNEAQDLVAQHNLAERTIRPITEKLTNHPALQLVALKQLVEWQQAEESGASESRRIVPSVKAFVEKLLSDVEPNSGNQPQPRLPELTRMRQKIQSTLRFMQRLNEDKLSELSTSAGKVSRAEILDDLKALRKRIDEMLKALEID